MLDRIEQSIGDLQHFAADAAHELRTPLANLRAEVETAIQERRSPEEYERILASASEEVGRMSRIVSDLFTLARIDMHQYEIQKEPVRIGPLIQEVTEMWAIPDRERKIDILAEGGDAEVIGNPVALRRVLMNLVENAVKYNREGGRIILSVGRDGGAVQIYVRDTGIGIPPEHVPRLFRRFYRVDKARSRDTGGVGLGLAICKSFVEAQGGRIGVSSVPGEGTVFKIDLPAAGVPS